MESQLTSLLTTARKFSIVGIALLTGFAGCGVIGYPTRDQMDDFFQEFQLQGSSDRRAEMLKDFLYRIRDPSSTSRLLDAEYAIDRMAELYLRTKDEAILIAVDATPIDGAFGQSLCGFYWTIRSEEEFLKRCRSSNEAKEAVGRSVGLSLSDEEMREITGAQE